MPMRSPSRETATLGFLTRLRKDTSGNVAAMMAAGVIPLVAMVGGAIDLSRLYMAKTRLQSACDAGALATRRSMASGTTVATADATIGKNFFDFNYPAASFGTQTISRDFKSGATIGTVNGTASAVVPTVIMKYFNYNTVTLNVACEATLNIPNTDVMFVLDVTGSMSEIPVGDTVSKIDGLKQAVKDFYVALGPGKSTGSGRIRYGFVPYSSNVNVGKIVYAANPNYIAGGAGSENWQYQTRQAQHVTEYYISAYGPESAQNPGTPSDSSPAYGSWNNASANVGAFSYRITAVSSSTCSGYAVPGSTDINTGSTNGPNYVSSTSPTYPTATQTLTYSSSQVNKKRKYRYSWASASGSNNPGICTLQYADGDYTRTTPSTTTRSVTWSPREKFTSWNYDSLDVDVSAVVQNGTADNPAYWDTSTSAQVWGSGGNKNGPAPSTITWDGCIEEAKSSATYITASTGLDIPADANDMNIDLVPYDINTKWKPFLPQVEYDTAFSSSNPKWQADPTWTESDFAACPAEASRLAMYTSDVDPTSKVSTSFASYVDSLQPEGYTYHDIGMTWGARFLSPTGIFASDNNDASGPGGFPIGRNIVYMTDGTLNTQSENYDPWGINRLDGRVAAKGASDSTMNASHKRRLQMLCNAMKGKGFTIWVVGFGISTLPSELTACATDTDHAAVASNSAALKAQFKKIAQSIGGLRLSQ